MDFFTHLMIGFLISSLASGSPYNDYVIFGTLLSVLPDFDVLLYPFWRSHPVTRHHGITHMLGLVVSASALIYTVLYFAWGVSDLGLFLLMCFNGSFHIFCDYITTWGVSPLYPLSTKYTKLNIDTAVNPYLILFTFIGALLLALAEFGYMPLSVYQSSLLLGSAYIAYFGLRLTLKLYYAHRPENRGFAALPTFLLHRWNFAKRIEDDKEIRVILKNNPGREYVIPKERLDSIRNCDDMIKTYWCPQVQEHMRVFSYPYFSLECDEGRFGINWFSAEMGENMRVHVTYDIKIRGRLSVEVDFKGMPRSFFK
jgi:membrane-bound metal-dependent hydrolase YbcI (DUF457 family)